MSEMAEGKDFSDATESMEVEPSEGDPADLAGAGAEETAGDMHGEVDDIADDGETQAGHGPSAD